MSMPMPIVLTGVAMDVVGPRLLCARVVMAVVMVPMSKLAQCAVSLKQIFEGI